MLTVVDLCVLKKEEDGVRINSDLYLFIILIM